MQRSLTVVMLGSLAMAAGVPIRAQQLSRSGSAFIASLETGSPGADAGAIPPLPHGRTTIFGGEIRSIDPVRDQMVLAVFGERSMKVLFDERTQVFRDGKRIPLRNFSPAVHASVETTLDGTKLFAVSVHLLSETPDGQYEGRVLAFDSSTGELTVASGKSLEPLKMLVPSGTAIVRKGQSTFSSAPSGPSDLRPGALVTVEFSPGKAGQGTVAKQIEILAVPGADFVFNGNVISIDMHSGSLVVMDPDDQQNHQVFVDPARVPTVESIHLGDPVRIVASYDGMRYVAKEFTAVKPQP
jgi:hypothetical protein